MIIISTKRLKPAMVAAQTVTPPDSDGPPLVTAGTSLDEKIISQLRQRNIPALAVMLPGAESLDKLCISDSTANIYKKLKLQLSGYFSQSSPHIDISEYGRLSSICAQMVTHLVRDRSNGCRANMMPLTTGKASSEKHGANVAYLALITALSIEGFMVQERRTANALAACDITNLAIGAALHDIGKIKMPSTLDIHQPDSEKPSRSYIQHTVSGPNMVSKRVSPTARSVIMHHHQYYDGSGFPDMAMVTSKRKQGTLNGRSIHIFSRIATICDHFDNLFTTEKPIAANAMLKLLDEKWISRFDPYILWAFSSMMPAMPIGSHVILQDGINAIVAAHNPKAPCRPDLMILDSNLKPVKTVNAGQFKSGYPKILKCMDFDVDGLTYTIPPEPKDKSSLGDVAQALNQCETASV